MIRSFFVLSTVLFLLACERYPAGEETAENRSLEIALQPDTRYQTIRNFGASDAWSCQFVGRNWPIDKREAIADLLFSQELRTDGSPVGIGLSSWRFNIGAASAAQGEDSDISDEWRRAEGFLLPDGTFDPGQQAGQRWFLGAAAERGVTTFTGFANSPPVALTKNGKAYSSGGNSANLAPERFAAFADFLVEVVHTLRQQDGIILDYISPVNEPQWDWDQANQEGSPWRNEEIAALVRQLDRAIGAQNLPTQIEIPEAAQIDYLYRTHNRPERSDQIETFFDPASPHYLGDLEHLAAKVAGHSYFSTWNIRELLSKRQALAEKLRTYPALEYWMSEYTLLEDNEEVKGGGRDLSIDPALYMARVIHADLTIAGAAAWQWWLAVSPYDYKDGLVYIDLNKEDGTFYPSKMLWTLGNYARFIRPGMVRIGLERSDEQSLETQLKGVMVSAFIHPDNSRITTVALNYSGQPQTVRIKRPTGSYPCAVYRTSATENLQFIDTIDVADQLLLPPRSITTLVE